MSKGPRAAAGLSVGEQDRAAIVAALECVDYVTIFDDDTPVSLIDKLRPDVLVKGGTYVIEQIVGAEIVRSYGGQVRVTSVVEGMSTSSVLGKARK